MAHGKLLGVDTQAALALLGVHAVLLANDVPGSEVLAAFAGDEPVFAQGSVQHVGQVIGLVVADNVMLARQAARLADLLLQPRLLMAADLEARKHPELGLRVVVNLRSAGLSVQNIADEVGISRSSLQDYCDDRNIEPAFWTGSRIIEVWCAHTGLRWPDLPVRDVPLSVSAVLRG